MAVIKAVHSDASIGYAIRYITKNEKTDEILISGKDCDPDYAIDQMKLTKELWNKMGGRQYDHYVQSFAQGENISPALAHEIANKWASHQFKGYECVVATHIDKGHIHSHVIVNTVNFENGKKLHTSAKWLERAKKRSDKLCKEHGLSITQKGKTFEGKERTEMTSFEKDKYQLLQKAENGKVRSYVFDTAVAVSTCKEISKSKEEFISKMAEKGYTTNWQDKHKYITFTDKDGHKVRNSNIEKSYPIIKTSKEELGKSFEHNREQENQKTTEIHNFSTNANIAMELEKIRFEWCELSKKIDAYEIKENTTYKQKISQIKNSVNELQRQEPIITRLQNEKDELGLFKSKQKKTLQEKIDRVKSMKQIQINKLKDLGIIDINYVDRKIGETQYLANKETERINTLEIKITSLKEKMKTLETNYLAIKAQLSNDKQKEIEKEQKRLRPKNTEFVDYMTESKATRIFDSPNRTTDKERSIEPHYHRGR